jgi:hypothetical protein
MTPRGPYLARPSELRHRTEWSGKYGANPMVHPLVRERPKVHQLVHKGVSENPDPRSRKWPLAAIGTYQEFRADLLKSQPYLGLFEASRRCQAAA